MKPIKNIAGDLLLYFYKKHRENGFPVLEPILFDNWDEITIQNKTEFSKDLMKLCDDNTADLYNALSYLYQTGFLNMSISQNSGGEMMHNFSITSSGIDIIEAIERGQSERNEFYVTFNIKLADNINIESLIKNELGSLIKGSIL